MTDDGQQTKNDHGGTEPNPGGASSRRAPPTIDLKSSDYSESPSPSSTESSSDSANQATSGRANVLHQYAVPAIAGAIAALVVAGPLMMSGIFRKNESPAPSPVAAPNQAVLDDLNARLARIEKIPAAPLSDPLLPARVATLEQSAQSARETLAALRRQVDSLSSAIVEVKNNAVKDDAPARVDDNEAKASAPALGEAELSALRERLTKLEQALDAVMAQAADTKAALPGLIAQGAANQNANPKLQVFASALTLDLRVRAGEAYQRELQDFKKVSDGAALIKPDDLAALELFAAKGVPSTRQLADDLSRALAANSAAPAPAQARANQSMSGSIVERLTAHAGKLVKIERVDSAAVPPNAAATTLQPALKSALAAAQRGDLAGAQAELSREIAQKDASQNSTTHAALADWIASVKAFDAARAASNAILTAARAQLATGR